MCSNTVLTYAQLINGERVYMIIGLHSLYHDNEREIENYQRRVFIQTGSLNTVIGIVGKCASDSVFEPFNPDILCNDCKETFWNNFREVS